MNATQDIAMKSVNGTTPLVDASATADAQITQREKNRRSFQAKCDAMLYIVEFIATFHLRNLKNPQQAKKMDDLKSLVIQTRNGLSLKH